MGNAWRRGYPSAQGLLLPTQEAVCGSAEIPGGKGDKQRVSAVGKQIQSS